MKTMYSPKEGVGVRLRLLIGLVLLLNFVLLGDTIESFNELIAAGHVDEARQCGNRLWHQIEDTRRGSKDVKTVSLRLLNAKKLCEQIVIGLNPLPDALLPNLDDSGTTTGLLVSPRSKRKNKQLPLANQLYWKYLKYFSSELLFCDLRSAEKGFVQTYYQLEMQSHIQRIVQQTFLVGNDDLNAENYALVLPLLVTHQGDANWQWIANEFGPFEADQLEYMSHFSLFELECIQASIVLARMAAEAKGIPFDLRVWTKSRAEQFIVRYRPNLAETLINHALQHSLNKQNNISLVIMVIEGYAKCKFYQEAKERCHTFLSNHESTPHYGRVKAMYFAYLAKLNDEETLLEEIDEALSDERCRSYYTQLQYLKWWALRKTNQYEAAEPIAIELIEERGKSSCVAPVLLSVAMDALSQQDYDKCRTLLQQLNDDFPSSDAASRGTEILDRLDGNL